MKTVVFACVHNAGRSQMAAAFFNALVDPRTARALSAGTRPAAEVHSVVVTAMAEAGIDLRGVRPTKLTPAMAGGAAFLITMGCGEDCPVIPGVRREDWSLPDPKDQSLDDVRAIRDGIRRRVEDLVARAFAG